MELFIPFSEIVRFFKRHLWKFAVLVVACGVLFGSLSLANFQKEYTATQYEAKHGKIELNKKK